LLQLMLNARSDDLREDIGGVGGDASHLAMDSTRLSSKKSKDRLLNTSLELQTVISQRNFEGARHVHN